MSTLNSNSVMTVNEGNECYKLELELNKLRAQLSEVRLENETLKERLELRHHQQQQKPVKTLAAARSPDEFVDVNAYTVAEQIERYLSECDVMFSDENSLKPAMEYLIKKVWSIIAHEYDESSLNASRATRNSLLTKLERASELIASASSVGELENQVESMKQVIFYNNFINASV